MTESDNKIDKNWESISKLGAIATIFVIIGIILDIIIGTSLGGNLQAIPRTAVERFAQFQANYWIGLYNLDLLNCIIQILFIPGFFALYAVHRKEFGAYPTFALILFLVGTTIFVSTNTALPMFELSKKFELADSSLQKSYIAGAGEAMLAMGSHGSPGVFFGFILPNVAGLIMSFVMLKGKIFSKITAYAGILGSILMAFYLIIVTFVPGLKDIALLLSIPGGLILLAWMVMFTVKLFRLPIKE